MSDVRRDIERGERSEWRKFHDQVMEGGTNVVQDLLLPYALYPAGMAATGAIVGRRLGRMIGKRARGAGTALGAVVGGSTGVYGSSKHLELRAKRKRK